MDRAMERQILSILDQHRIMTLAVEPQQVVPGQTESADGWH